MVLRVLVPLAVGAALVAGSYAMAADYRPDEFLSLDLSKAVFSPKQIGPEAHFEPFPVKASSEPAIASSEPVPEPAAKPETPAAVATAPATPSPRIRLARPLDKPLAKPPGAARTKLAHRHGNPMDAQAMDTRIQTWPCKPGSGGICNWK